MPDQERASCTACGAANTVEAAHCWQCYARFMPLPPAPRGSATARTSGSAHELDRGARGAVGDTQRVRPGFPPPVATTAPVQSAKAGSGVGAGLVVRIVMGTMVAFASFAFVRGFLERGVQIPDSIAGASRMTDASAVDFEQQMKDEADKFGMEVQAAAFGSTGRPDFLLVVANGSAVESTDELFASFTEGIAQGGASVSGAPTSGDLGGASYRCVGASGNGIEVGTCMWRANDHVGVVFDLDGDVVSAQRLSATIYDELTA